MADQPVPMRRCIGSERFGIAPHEAPAADFPRQPSQKDGLGRMCRTHWNTYTKGLAREAKARTAAASATEETPAEAAAPTSGSRRPRPTVVHPEPGAQGDAG